MRTARNPFTVALLAAALAGCSTQVTGTGTAGAVTAAPTSSSAVLSGTGITAEPLSTALPVQARDLRLVRVGANELALQFEFANNGDRRSLRTHWASTSISAFSCWSTCRAAPPTRR